MMDVESITLEDNKNYMVLMEKDNYVYLVEENNPENFCIRKSVVIDGEEFLTSLDSDEEFDKAFLLFSK